ncbi:NAD(P)H-dependent flavin oxidoreductase [Bdellovibrio bacteriovorus]
MISSKKNLSAILGLKYPLIVAPMAGGPSSPELVIASCEAGALGSVGAAYLDKTAIKEFVSKVRAKTQNPLAINLFIASNLPKISDVALAKAVQQTQKYRDEFNSLAPTLEPPYEEDFDKQFEMILELKPAVFSFVFGCPPDEYLSAAHKAGIYTIGTATTAEECQRLEDAGVKAVVLQGFEAGGHRGIFDPNIDDPNISLADLIKQVRGKTKIPIIGAGGIMNKIDVATVLQSGADAVQMGTAFLATKEAGTSSPYRNKLLSSADRKTKLTRAFSGRLARGIENRFMNEIDTDPSSILPFPAQNKFTRDLRSASVAANSAEFLSLWCGTGRGELWTGATAELINLLFS